MGTKAHSLAHTKWLCKYHIVFTPKYRRKIIFTQLRESIKEILQCLCKYKGVEILEGHLMPDHVHMLVSIPPKSVFGNFSFYSYKKACGQKKTVRGSKNSRRLSNGTPAI